ncbi:hypothetical protein BDB01DRAFT_759333 [Pilobolus umbonatus]|nr:hypothetical protein BDB01DRAFT_759333 [Pilobolus umbonatus]
MTDVEKYDLDALVEKYDTFINTKLKPSLQKVLEERDTVFATISEYHKVNTQISLIEDNELKELKTMVDLGSQFYCQAHIPDTKYIYINVGFGFHVQFTLEEAKKFIVKKEAQLQNMYASFKNRSFDLVLLIYFITHIPITLLFDLQAIYPIEWVPQILVNIKDIYVGVLSDPFMSDTQPTQYWFKGLVCCEALLQTPFFFVAIYGLLKNKQWIRLPLIIYGAHVTTTVIPCLTELLFNSSYQLTSLQLPVLLSLYFPYFLIPLLATIHSSLYIYRLIQQNESTKKTT